MTSAFIGRESELRQLQRRLEAVTNGQGHVILIQGEAGIGKTSLVERFLNLAARRHPQVLTARGQCSERFGSGEGYLPFVEALGALLEGREEMSVRDRILDVVLERRLPRG